ncbi:FAD binding domain in molybdopterin dehydrogenase [uncultured Eubacteriales bacterium]|uniref:FAD binding domain in molybdopterin dehydrogenase n=1 Tax=uncultured Eubacteriales bacterium TaxID=172733 RepID=A0A212J5C3_9FIRM|nr:FAD binding domain in molybdopterin dehydrogenase [uncultured Eubacteriales bacterium]
MVNGYAPVSLSEALELLAAHTPTPYAGGTDLMIEEERECDYLFLHKIPELKQVTQDEQYLRFGAGCTFTELLEHELTPALLKEALALIAAPAIRNEGTIGGNIGNGSAKADSALIFFVTDSKLRLVSSKGERIVSIKSFYKGRKRLDLAKDELIAEVLMPKKWLGSYCYQKVGARKALAISRLSFAGLMTVEDGKIAHCATAFGAVSDVIIRREDIDAMLIGKTVEEAKAEKAAYLKAFDDAIVPIRGRVSQEYRKSVCMSLLSDFLNQFGI